MVVGNDVGAQVLARQEALKPEQKFQLMTSPSHIGLNKGEDRLKQAVNDTVAKMLADGTLEQMLGGLAEGAAQSGQPQGLSRWATASSSAGSTKRSARSPAAPP